MMKIITGLFLFAALAFSQGNIVTVAYTSTSFVNFRHGLNFKYPYILCYDSSDKLLGSAGSAAAITGILFSDVNNAAITLDSISSGHCQAQGNGGVVALAPAISFLKSDSVTSGAWKGVYGLDGSFVIGDVPKLSALQNVTPSGNSMYVWVPTTKDARGLQKAVDRVAACWYSSSSFSVDLNIPDGKSHQVALYFLDWDNFIGGRSQRVEILDSVGKLVDTRTLSNFSGGAYLVWTFSGKVTVRITNLNPLSNAVLSGLFFDPASIF